MFLDFTCRQVILYPKGNDSDDCLSLYLYAGDLSIFPNDWSIFANFNLALINQVNSQKTITKGIVCTFLPFFAIC